MGNGSARRAPLALPAHRSRDGFSPSWEEAERAARRAAGQGERCLEQKTQPFAVRNPGGAGVCLCQELGRRARARHSHAARGGQR